jgi:hypothetical protein
MREDMQVLCKYYASFYEGLEELKMWESREEEGGFWNPSPADIQ